MYLLKSNNNQIKVTKEYSIQYFAFYYNNIYKVHKDAKYSTE